MNRALLLPSRIHLPPERDASGVPRGAAQTMPSDTPARNEEPIELTTSRVAARHAASEGIGHEQDVVHGHHWREAVADL
jgi:hypothetical protein